jgi:hypothetical protein
VRLKSNKTTVGFMISKTIETTPQCVCLYKFAKVYHVYGASQYVLLLPKDIYVYIYIFISTKIENERP